MNFIYSILLILYTIDMMKGSIKNLIYAFHLRDPWAFILSLFLILVSVGLFIFTVGYINIHFVGWQFMDKYQEALDTLEYLATQYENTKTDEQWDEIAIKIQTAKNILQELVDKEKVLKAVKACSEFCCGECPYQHLDDPDGYLKMRCIHSLMVDINKLLNGSEE